MASLRYVVRGAVAVALFAAGVACSHPGNDVARKQAIAACRAYVSVNGMTGDQGRAAYHRGVSLAASAAHDDPKWAAFAAAFGTLSKWSDDLEALGGNVSAAEGQAGAHAGMTVATQCQALLPNDPNLNLRPRATASSG